MFILLIAVVLWELAFTQRVAVNNCLCQRNNNKYIQLAEHGCEKFTQYDNTTRLTHTQSCPQGLRFSVDTCVCERSQEVACEGCGPPVCEVELNRRFDETMNLMLAGNCSKGKQVVSDILESCVIKDPVERTLMTLRVRDARQRKTQCQSPPLPEGCELVGRCTDFMVRPLEQRNYNSDDSVSDFLCENYKEAMKCLRCAEANGCQLAEQYGNSLKVAAAKLCSHFQVFTCPADVLV